MLLLLATYLLLLVCVCVRSFFSLPKAKPTKDNTSEHARSDAALFLLFLLYF